MTKIKRYSPLIILFDLGKLLKNSFFFIIYLYVIKANSGSPITKYGRILFLIIIGLTLFSIIYKWFTHKYKLDKQSFHLYKGLFSKSERTIPFSKVQNVNRHTSLFHRIFKMTSIHFETAVTGENATVKFEVISKIEAEQMETHVRNVDQDATDLNQEYNENDPNAEIEHQDLDRTIHFQPTKRDVLKASFTSLSFLVLIPLIGSLYYSFDEVFQIEGVAKDFFEWTISSWWVITVIVISLLLASIAFGIIRTFIKYGKYEISSDSDYIYITKGMIDETAFSILKEKVQAIEIEQTLMKRLLGLAGVKLRSAGGLGEDTLEINTLYPFLPIDKAYEMIAEILPSYTLSQEMNELPRKSFWVRMLSPSWFWLIATGALFYFKPPILNMEHAWLFISIALLLFILILRILDFSNTRYLINNQFIQFKTGALTTSLFISKREKVIEVGITRNIMQKTLGLASVETINRGSPVHHTNINDVPIKVAHEFFHWYVNRKNEVEIE